MSFKRDKEALYALQPTVSGPEMGRIDDARNSYYRGHLTYMENAGGWVAWVEYDHHSGPGLMRAAITEHPSRRDVALAALNQRLRAKQFDNARSGRSGNYTPLCDAETGEITGRILADRLAFIDRMNEEAA
jgi:hypothetical protein